MSKQKPGTHRTYRLRDMLRKAGFCEDWIVFVQKYETAEQVLTAINADPWAWFGNIYAADGVRYAADTIARKLRRYNEAEWWWYRRCDLPSGTSVTNEERDRFIALWIAYADKHGLYTEVAK